MTKHEFIYALRCRLQDLPVPETEPHIEYYTEMIEDRIDEGMTEEEAVADIGTLDEIEHRIRIQCGRQAAEDTTDSFRGWLARMRLKLHWDGPLKAWQVIILVLVIMSIIPLMGTLLGVIFSGFGIVLGLWTAVMGMMLGIYAIVGGLFAGGIGIMVAGIVQLVQQQTGEGLFMLGVGFVLLGLSALALWVVILLTKLLIKGVRRLMEWIRGLSKKRRRIV